MTGNRFLNPPFDKRILNIGAPGLGGKKLKRGRLVLDSTKMPGMKGKMIRFLYNPVSVAVSHYIATDGSGVYTQDNSTSTASPQMGTLSNLGGLSLSLLYDRTYEVWSAKHLPGNAAARLGVYADILAFYQMLGLVEYSVKHITPHHEVLAGDNNVISVSSSMSMAQFPVKPIDPLNRYFVYVGDLRWYGLLNDFEINYTHFSRDMIPMRAEVDISIQFQKDPHSATHTVTGSAYAVHQGTPPGHKKKKHQHQTNPALATAKHY